MRCLSYTRMRHRRPPVLRRYLATLGYHADSNSPPPQKTLPPPLIAHELSFNYQEKLNNPPRCRPFLVHAEISLQCSPNEATEP